MYCLSPTRSYRYIRGSQARLLQDNRIGSLDGTRWHAISAKHQACCLNFNRTLKELVGIEFGLDADLSLALQFSAISRDQQDILVNEADLPANIRAMRTEFENSLTDELVQDLRYAYRVAFIEKAVNSKGRADQVVQFVRAGTEEGEEIQRILLKETEKLKLKPQQIVEEMQTAGFPKFSLHHHTELWKQFGRTRSKKILRCISQAKRLVVVRNLARPCAGTLRTEFPKIQARIDYHLCL